MALKNINQQFALLAYAHFIQLILDFRSLKFMSKNKLKNAIKDQTKKIILKLFRENYFNLKLILNIKF